MVRIAAFALLPIFGIGPAGAQNASDGSSARKELRASKLAAGGDAWNDVRTLHTLSRIEAAGLAGHAESWTELSTGRFVDRYTLGPTSGAHGFDGSVSWFTDGSGAVRIENTPDSRLEAANESYRRSLGMWFPERHAAEILDEGAIADLDHRFRIVRITPAGGRPFEIWLDSSTFLPARIIEKGPVQTQTTHLSDYRLVHGLWIPYGSRITNGDRLFDQQMVVESVEINVPIAPGAFAPPRPAPPPG